MYRLSTELTYNPVSKVSDDANARTGKFKIVFLRHDLFELLNLTCDKIQWADVSSFGIGMISSPTTCKKVGHSI